MFRSCAQLLPLFLIASCVHTPAPTVQDNLASTVRLHITTTIKLGDEIVAASGWCSGVVLGSASGGSTILSAAHCVTEDLPVVRVGAVITGVDLAVFDMYGEEKCGASVVKMDAQKDLSLLLASCSLPPAQLSKTPAQPGDKVIATGYPLGSPFVIATDGYVSTLMDMPEGDRLLAFSAPIASGNSGGPLWLNGQVVGIVVQGHVTYHHISLATPLEAILEFLK